MKFVGRTGRLEITAQLFKRYVRDGGAPNDDVILNFVKPVLVRLDAHNWQAMSLQLHVEPESDMIDGLICNDCRLQIRKQLFLLVFSSFEMSRKMFAIHKENCIKIFISSA